MNEHSSKRVGQATPPVASAERTRVGQATSPVASAERTRVGQATPPVASAKPAAAYYKRKLPHIQRPGKTLFITFNTLERWTMPSVARRITLDCALFWHTRKLHMHAAVVMPDHVHLLLTPMRAQDGSTYGLAEIMQSMKSVSSRRINWALGRIGRVWQAESFDHILRSNESTREKAEYICANPVRAGLVAHDDDYPWLWREWIEGVSSVSG